jgi:hypothetical protein
MPGTHRLGLVIALALVTCATVRAGALPNAYDASRIAPNLLRNADAVIRDDSLVFTVDGVRTTTVGRHVVTVLNPAGRHFGTLRLYYDKFQSVEDIRGRLLDAQGAKIRSLEDDDIQDHSAISDYSLYDDLRMQRVALYHETYPYTVEFEYTLESTGSLNWPEWCPENRRASVERSTFEVRQEDTTALRWWSNAGLCPRITRTSEGLVYRWEASNLPPFEPEVAGPPTADQYSCVKIAPSVFEVEGHSGDLSSWESFGRWFRLLSEDRQTLSHKTLAEVVALTGTEVDAIERVRRLYHYMQSRTRYVSIQLGIGAWQPFPASYVEERGYGDCKALTNYMSALLKAAHIESFPALIRAGAEPRWLVKEFPHNCFNHVILCVPMPTDTFWLECTSQTVPFAHLGAETENRFALVVTDSGGVLRRTPASASADNAQIRHATVQLTAAGDGFATVQMIYTGNQQDHIRGSLAEATPREREEWLAEDIDIPTGTLREADFSGLAKGGERIDLSYRVDFRRYASPAGARLLLAPNLLQKRTYIPPADSARKQPIMHGYPYLDIDTIRYVLPGGYAVEVLPKPVMITTPFGLFAESTVAAREGELLLTRRLEITATELPALMYDAYRSFWSDVVKADKALVGLVRR